MHMSSVPAVTIALSLARSPSCRLMRSSGSRFAYSPIAAASSLPAISGGAPIDSAVARRARRAADVRRRRLEIDQAAVGDRQEAGAELGERDAAGGALEQAEAELVLQLAHQHAHSGLRNEQPLRGAREALVAGRQQKRLQLAGGDIHGQKR